MPLRFSVDSDHQQIINVAAKILLGPSFNWTSTALREELSAARTLVFERDRVVRSFLCFRELPDYFEITVLATEPDYARLGLQSELIKYLQELAAQQQKRILLEVHHGNSPARALYAGIGFSELHRRPKYYSDGATAVVLEWRNKAGCES